MTSHGVVVGITGASGSIHGIRILECLEKLRVETRVVVSEAGRLTKELEAPSWWRRVQRLASMRLNLVRARNKYSKSRRERKG